MCGSLNATEKQINMNGEVFRAPDYPFPEYIDNIPGGGGLEVEEPDEVEEDRISMRAESRPPKGYYERNSKSHSVKANAMFFFCIYLQSIEIYYEARNMHRTVIF